MSNLPKGWVEITISDLTEVVGGGTPSTAKKEYFEGDLPWITPADLSGYKSMFISQGRRYLSDEGLQHSSARILPKNSVIYSTRAPIGYVAIAANEIATNQGFKSMLPSEAYDSKYAYYYLKSIKAYAESEASGTTFKELSGKKFGELKFPLAPLPEQKRIVAKLDSLFAHLDQLRIRLEKIPVLLKQFRQAVLTQAVTGKLTGTAFEFAELGSVLSDVTYGTSMKSDYETEGIPILRIPNIKDGEINDNDLKFSKLPIEEYEKLKLGAGDVLIIRSNGSLDIVGQAAIVRSKNIGQAFAGYLIRLRVSDRLISEYLNYSLQSSFMRSQIVDRAHSTTGVNNINSKQIQGLKIPVPPVEEQKEIVRRVKSLFATSDHIEAHYQTLRKKIDQLPQAILSKAFRGELVAQEVFGELNQYSSQSEELSLAAEIEPAYNAKGTKTLKT